MLPFANNPTWFEQFAAAFGVFLATPSQVIPASLGLAGFVLGVINLARSFRTAARPNLRASAYVGLEVHTHEFAEGDEDYREVYFTIRNRGDSTAHDVRAIIRQKNGKKLVRDLRAIEPDAVRRETLAVHPEHPADGIMILKYARGPWWGVRVKFEYEEP